MRDRDTWLFDLQGFLVIPGFLTEQEVTALNAAVDANIDRAEPSYDNDSIGDSTALRGDGKRMSLAGLLTFPDPWCHPFRDLLAHCKLTPYLNTLLGRGWRMDHTPHIFIAEHGAPGLMLHGPGQTMPATSIAYSYANGQIRCGMIALEYALTDAPEGAGGFCAIPGSHKMNFHAPREILECDLHREVVASPAHRAGDLIIFNEATVHGTLPWTAAHQRRALLYRYSPKWINYAGDVPKDRPAWFAELTDAQRAVLEPPYMPNRTVIADNGSLDRTFLEF